jgi:DNA-binding transcriptional LysR family regulator
MNFKALRTFRLIVKNGSLAAAAKEMNISPPAASRLITMLEAETKLRLFHRTRRRLVLTRIGEKFYRETQHILAGFDEIPRIVDDIRSFSEDRLHLVTAPRIGQGLVAPALAMLRQQNPKIRCLVDMQTRFDIEAQVGARRYDLGIVSLPISNQLVEIENRPLFRVRIEALLPKGHQLASKKSLSASDLADEPLVGLWPDQAWRQQIDDFFRSGGAKVKYAVEVRSSLMACQLVKEGAGVTLLDRICARSIDLREVVMRPITPKRWIVFGYVHQVNQPLSTNAEKFLDCACEVIEKFRAQSRQNREAVIPLWDNDDQDLDAQ